MKKRREREIESEKGREREEEPFKFEGEKTFLWENFNENKWSFLWLNSHHPHKINMFWVLAFALALASCSASSQKTFLFPFFRLFFSAFLYQQQHEMSFNEKNCSQ